MSHDQRTPHQGVSSRANGQFDGQIESGRDAPLSAVRQRYPGLNIFTKGGRLYIYHRKTKTAIKARPIGSPEFEAEIARFAGLASDRARPGTLAACFDSYRRQPEFTGLSPRTKSDYEKVMGWARDAAALIELHRLAPPDVVAIRNRAFETKKRHFANYVVVVLRLVLDHAVAEGWIDTNPARNKGIKKIRRPRSLPPANPPWLPEEREIALATAQGGVKVMLAIGMFTGMRESDALHLTELDYSDGPGGAWLKWTQGKTTEPMEMPVHPRLREILAPIVTARREVRASGDPVPLRLVTGRGGRPYTGDGFRTMWWRFIQGLEREGKVRPGLTFHGLRHSAGTYLADAGASQEMIMALLGHKTLAMSQLYTSRANRKKLAASAVALLYPTAPGLSDGGTSDADRQNADD